MGLMTGRAWTLWGAGLVLAVLTVVDREEGAKEKLAEAGYRFITLFAASELLENTSV